MNFRKTMLIAVLLWLAVLFVGLAAQSGSRGAALDAPQQAAGGPHCVAVGGSISTNLCVIDANTR